MLVKTWKTTNQIIRKLHIFVSKCLRQIMKIKRTEKITNEELWRITQQKSIENQMKIRKWNWIGHTLRKEAGAGEKTALDWNPQGYRRRGRPKRTWRRTIEDEIRGTGRSWNEVKVIAGDRNAWKLYAWWWWKYLLKLLGICYRFVRFLFSCTVSKDFRLMPTEGGVAVQVVHGSLREPYVVRICTFQNIFTWKIYRFLPGRDLVPVCWRTHSCWIYRLATPLVAKRIASGVKVMVHYDGQATKPAQISDLPTS
jgi:hypothetical protein